MADKTEPMTDIMKLADKWEAESATNRGNPKWYVGTDCARELREYLPLPTKFTKDVSSHPAIGQRIVVGMNEEMDSTYLERAMAIVIWDLKLSQEVSTGDADLLGHYWWDACGLFQIPQEGE